MFKSIAVALTLATFALSTPLPRAAVTDTQVLQFALTLEHLENAFYTEALSKFSEQDFADAGFEPWVRGRFNQISKHEAAHVAFLESALGDSATKPCKYSFPFDSPRSFAALSMVLETVGGSAYLGAAQFLQDKGTLTDAASILAAESRHSGWVSAAVLKNQPWEGAFETPLLPSGAFSLAAQFITSCPSDNPALPVQAHPALSVSTGTPTPGASVKFTVGGSGSSGTKFVAWLDGVGDPVYTAVGSDGSTTVPKGLAGTVYAAMVSSKDGAVSDATLLSGFAVFQFTFSSQA
ncbi:ferritin-like domain-containing protein [Epithele typhae]|uniref:ferritin-like domain-containing protein n=1 Tax=Epithele typhae TaxID=378194 RepID=UPI00200856ED|nr:ferritin-like domain-containing protein [Epithele typhae]KAH9934474.1 ferritin-like domain-containing protein [Epithele typhae]